MSVNKKKWQKYKIYSPANVLPQCESRDIKLHSYRDAVIKFLSGPTHQTVMTE